MFRIIIFLLFYGFTNLIFTNPVLADQKKASIDYIRGEGDVEGIKIAIQYESGLLDSFSPNLELYFESSLNLWEYGKQNRHDSNFVLAISPVVSYQFAEWYGNPLSVEFGIGLSLLDDTQFAGKDVSTHYQFEDRLGLAYRFGSKKEYSVALRYFHYSNAGFKKPNPGLDFISLSFSRYF